MSQNANQWKSAPAPQVWPAYPPPAAPTELLPNRYGTQSLTLGVIFLVTKALAFIIGFAMGMNWASQMSGTGRSQEEIARTVMQRMQTEGFFLILFEWFGNIVGFLGFLFGLIGVAVKDARKGQAIAGLIIGSLAVLIVAGAMLMSCARH
jgi:hypothetical protein